MTVAVLIISSLIAAWAYSLAGRSYRIGAFHTRIACLAIHYMFGAIAIGAGIQLLFRG